MRFLIRSIKIYRHSPDYQAFNIQTLCYFLNNTGIVCRVTSENQTPHLDVGYKIWIDTVQLITLWQLNFSFMAVELAIQFMHFINLQFYILLSQIKRYKAQELSKNSNILRTFKLLINSAFLKRQCSRSLYLVYSKVSFEWINVNLVFRRIP